MRALIRTRGRQSTGVASAKICTEIGVMRLKSAVIAATALAGPANSGCNREGGTYAVLEDTTLVEIVIRSGFMGLCVLTFKTLLLTAEVPTDVDADAVDPFHCQIIAKIIRQVAQYAAASVSMVIIATATMVDGIFS